MATTFSRARIALPLFAAALFVAAPALADRTHTFRGANGLVAFTSQNGGTGPRKIFVAYPDGLARRQLTFGGAADHRPSFSPNGRQIAFVRQVSTTYDLYVVNVDGSGERRLTNDGAGKNAFEWSPDGTRIAYSDDRSNVWVVSATGGAPIKLASASTNGNLVVVFADPTWSPDGTKLAYVRMDADFGEGGSFGARIETIAPAGGAATVAYALPGRALAGRLVYGAGGTKLAFAQQTPVTDASGAIIDFRDEIFVLTLATGAVTRISQNAATVDEVLLDWSPATDRVLFTSTVRATGARTTRTMLSSGASRTDVFTSALSPDLEPVFSPDGQRVAFLRYANGNLTQGYYNARIDGADLKKTSSLLEDEGSWGVLVMRDVLRLVVSEESSYTVESDLLTGDIDATSTRIRGTGTTRSVQNRVVTITFDLSRPSTTADWIGTIRVVEPTVIDRTITMDGATIDPAVASGSKSYFWFKRSCNGGTCWWLPMPARISFTLYDRI